MTVPSTLDARSSEESGTTLSAACRSAIVRLTCSASSGVASRRPRIALSSIPMSVQGLAAMTVALRGSPVMSAISPKKLPGPGSSCENVRSMS